MKNLRMALFAALSVLVFASFSEAALMNPVQFWVYDEPGLPGDSRVTLSVSNFDFSGASVPATLQYSVGNNTDWTNASSLIDLTGEQHQLCFRLVPRTGSPITSGDLNLMGQTGYYYSGATINWVGYSDITIGVTGNNDKLSDIKITGAPVPIPAAAWLLGSGLIGLVGMRRKLRG